MSRHASYESDTAPADPTTATSMFQTTFGRNLVAIKALRWLAWLRPLSGSVVWMTVAY